MSDSPRNSTMSDSPRNSDLLLGGRDTPTIPLGERDTPTIPLGGRDTPTTTLGGRDTPSMILGGRDTPNLLLGGRDTPTLPMRHAKTPEPVARVIMADRELMARKGSLPEIYGKPYPGTPLSTTPAGTPPRVGTPPLSGTLRPPRPSTTPPRPSTPSTTPVSPVHSDSPARDSLPGSGVNSRRSSLLFGGGDSRRGSLTKKAIIGLAKDARKGIRNVQDTSKKAGQKVVDSTKETSQKLKEDVGDTAKMVKSKTVSVTGHVKDATVGASQWVATRTSATAKAAMEQAKSGLSFGEKFTLYSFEKITAWYRRGFTHVMIFMALAGYTALGAGLFMMLEGPHEVKVMLDLKTEKERFIEKLWEEKEQTSGSFEDFHKVVEVMLAPYNQHLYEAWGHGVSLHDNGTLPQEEIDKPQVWTFWKTMFFCSTITTTIGYGHITPATDAGKVLTIVYAIIGIPLFLILMADFGKLFTRLLKALFVFIKKMYRTATCKRMRTSKPVQTLKTMLRRGRGWCGALCGKGKKEEPNEEEEQESDMVDDNFNLPISLALLILLVYIMLGCILYTMWEDWSFFEAFYFIFVSMTTIGFGDYVPQITASPDTPPLHPAFMMMTTVYLVFGLALTAMCINIIQEKLTDTFRKATEKLKTSIGQIMAAASQGEDGSCRSSMDGKEVEVAPVHGEEDATKTPQDGTKTPQDATKTPQEPKTVKKDTLVVKNETET